MNNQPKVISVFDTGIASYNLGNQIIMDAVQRVMDELFPTDFIIHLPIEDIKRNARHYNAMSSMTFVGGTNVLNSDIRRYRQWDLTLHNIMILKNLVLCGCGWWKYEEQSITRYTQWALKKVLSNEFIHSVRDSYTQQRLEEIGIKAINTGCPTLWQIDQPLMNEINAKPKQDSVVVTITDYDPHPERDQLLLNACAQEYEHVYVFIQGTGDYQYVQSLRTIPHLEFIEPRIEAYNRILDYGKVDYIGTRLHAGIRAIQRGVRSYIIAIDNRSREMSRDFGLPIIEVDQMQDLSSIINGDYHLDIRLPLENIRKWKNQFRNL